jgi:predicted transcriptional regulator
MLQKMKAEIELLTRHVLVVRAVMEHQPIGIMKLSELLDLPFHRIRYSLRVLEQLGYIRATPTGAVVTYITEEFLRNLDRDIDELIVLLESMKLEKARIRP